MKGGLIFTLLLCVYCSLVGARAISTYQIDTFLKLSMFPENAIDSDDHFLSNCSSDTHVNLYLADFMEGQWNCHIADCLSRKALSPTFLSLSNLTTLRFLMGPFLDILYNSRDCPTKLRLAFQGMSEFLMETPSIPVEVRVIETTSRLDKFGNATSCSSEQRLYYNIIVPDFCDTTCLNLCYQDYISLDHLNRAVTSFELRRITKLATNIIDLLSLEKDYVLNSFGKNNTEVAFIEGTVINRALAECVRTFESAIDENLILPPQPSN